MALEAGTARWRANPNYELIFADQLPDAERQQWRTFARDADFCAMLRSRHGPGQRIRLICKNTADLYTSLATPAALPAGLRAELGDDFESTMARLLADGILEIERDGCFISGVEAYDLIRSGENTTVPAGRISRLSLAALKYAQALDIADSVRLCARLYFYNRVPAAPDLLCRLPGTEAVLRFLGASGSGPLRSLLETQWAATGFSDAHSGWLLWRRPSGFASAAQSGTYKLYVSPALEALPEVFALFVSVVTEQSVPVFKTGKDLAGLLRPDKLIAYFSNFDHLQETAQRLAGKLMGAPVQGVPFTAELGCDGLLSWGIDPPVPPTSTALEDQESWRVWLASRLAGALIAAKAAKTDNAAETSIEPWRFAVERVRLEGVDTDTWTPVASIWKPSPPNSVGAQIGDN